MNSREKVLAAIASNKPPEVSLPEVRKNTMVTENLLKLFTNVAISIGGKVFHVDGYSESGEIIRREFAGVNRMVSNIAALSFPSEHVVQDPDFDPHNYENVELAILEGKIAVAENGAIWMSEKEMGQRVLPFICQHLVLFIHEKEIVANMHQAYEHLGNMEEGFGTFIAGPSKTADIEQSLVLGAHGPRSLTIFCIKKEKG